MSDGEPVTRGDATRNAWQLHTVLAEWTRAADAKASFALALESAAVAAVSALSGTDRALGGISSGPAGAVLWTGTGLLALAAVLAVSAVFPRHAGDGRTRSAHRDAYIFYGDIRHWNPDELTEGLVRHDPLPALTRQLVTMSRILWLKQRLVQLSLLVAVGGCLLIAGAALGG
ncbi:Pycsar system effector family protein [Streptomyces sp. NPDC048290]|uniref:Pycsar system effector family protein n=1 Tax=Streptomyces sp. NPDC048290 TaxID=3155811 RepID=UPI00342F3923